MDGYEKAYDRLRWDFIHDTLLQMNLPDSLIAVIMNCISSSTLNILWNGEPTESFTPSRGIRQGDRLSPYLFVACIERLAQLIETSYKEGHWKALPITRGGIRLSHLMFVDDVVLFGEASKARAQVINDCLNRFCEASGQKISTQKSRVYFSPNTNEAVRAEVCGLLGITSTTDLGRYLGVPVIHGRVTTSTFQDVITRVDKRLAGWKTKCLSLAGRTTLIQSTIAAIPAYVMQSAKLPCSLCDTLDKKIRRFLWGGTAMERKTHLVSWNKIIKEKAQGGLGIRSMRQLNSAFLMKLGWRVKTEPSALWVRILKEKYSRGRELEGFNGHISSVSNAWRGIRETMALTKKGMGFTIGDGRLAEFWNHAWLDKQILREQTRCHIPEAQQGYKVCEYWQPNIGWDWATLSQFLPTNILQRIASMELLTEVVGDQPVWKASRTGNFTIQSAIQLIQDPTSTTGTPWARLWKIRTPHRVRMFIWLLFHRCLLTNAEKVRRKMSTNPQCELCPGEVEDLQHLFRSCEHAQLVWYSLAESGTYCEAQEAEFPVWIQQNLDGSHVDPNWPTKFTITLWYIWKWRCAQCHNQFAEIPSNVGEFLLHKFQEVLQALDKYGPDSSQVRFTSDDPGVCWEPPMKGWMVLNTDGAAKGGLGPAGVGGVLRNDKGEWMVGFSGYLGHCSAMTAELKAVIHGLKVAKEMGVRRLGLRVDSSVLVGMLKELCHGHPEYHFLIQQCKKLLDSTGWEVRITHCVRETNRVADALANIGITGRWGMTTHQDPPREIQSILYADKMGFLWPRRTRN